jgi:DNA-binding response OmpR family regulator
MQLLYVENHARFARLTVAQFLSSHQVTVVPSLIAARQALTLNTFDVVLVDYDLDDGKGDELVRELRTQSPRPFIIAVSSHQDGNDALVAAGADATCSKMQFANIEAMLSSLNPKGDEDSK